VPLRRVVAGSVMNETRNQRGFKSGAHALRAVHDKRLSPASRSHMNETISDPAASKPTMTVTPIGSDSHTVRRVTYRRWMRESLSDSRHQPDCFEPDPESASRSFLPSGAPHPVQASHPTPALY
jgi:hypothetical protein